MRADVYRQMALAVACNLSCDEAYEIIQQSFIDSFDAFYKRIPDGPEKPTMIDAMITFTMRELPILTGIEDNILFELQSKRDAIVNTFIHDSVSAMVTKLASRDVILEEIRKFLRRENKIQSVYALLNTTRVDAVFAAFLEVFRDNCAHAYQFGGSFIRFVMNCFLMYFYKGNKQNVWAMISEVDVDKRDVEKNIVAEKVLEVHRDDDLLIHDLLLNISIVNDLMFLHAGQSKEAYGCQYDIYYLILCELCKINIDRINSSLGYQALVFVDPLDRRRGPMYNKGIGSKIHNAQDMVPYIFEYVRSGKLSTASLTDLRDKCFTLGKSDNEGRNCIWKDVVDGGETSHYLDTPMAAENYSRFDQVLKGVVSVHTLMTELEQRGIPLVDSYNPELVQDKSIIRYMDYLSSVKYLELIKKLQQEPVDLRKYSSELYEFDKMVDTYAGSAVNNHTNIRENRYYAITHGFLVKPKLKQSTVPVSQFDILRAVAQSFDAVPHGDIEYMMAKGPHFLEEHQFDPSLMLDSVDVVAGKYTDLYFNYFLNKNPDKAEYYLLGRDGHKSRDLLFDLEWNVGTARYEGLLFQGYYGVYVPLERSFFFYDFESRNDTFMTTLEEVQRALNSRGGIAFNRLYSGLKIGGIVKEFVQNQEHSIGFPWEIGLINIGRTDVQSRISQIGQLSLAGPINTYIGTFYTWLDEVAVIQHSFVEVLKTMFTQAMYMTSRSAAIMTGRQEEIDKCTKLRDGLMTGVFDEPSLNWFLDTVRSVSLLETVDWSLPNFGYREVDLSVLNYLYAETFEELEQECLSPSRSIFERVRKGKTPAQRFTLLYNCLYTKLHFLRIVRDAFALIVDTTPQESSTLVCELNMNFNVGNTLDSFVQSKVDYGILTSEQDFSAVKEQIIQERENCIGTFGTLLKEFNKFLRECEDEIAKLVSYDVVAQDVVASRFAEFDRAFKLLRRVEGVRELDLLRQRSTCDSAGFFLLNGSYFKGRNGSKLYYVHRSGHMVFESPSGFSHVDLELNNADERALYSSIIAKGMEDAEHQNQ